MKLALGLLVLGAAMVSSAEKQPKDRYQPVVDRQMFGRVPEGFDPTKPPSTMTKEELKKLEEQQEQLRSAIRLSMINITPDRRVAVGFTDSGYKDGKPVKHYLHVGESEDGWMVKDADPITTVVVLYNENANAEVTLKLGEDSSKVEGATTRAELNGKKEVAADQPARRTIRERKKFRQQEREREAEERRKADEDLKRINQEMEEQRAENEALKNEVRLALEQSRTDKRDGDHGQGDAEGKKDD